MLALCVSNLYIIVYLVRVFLNYFADLAMGCETFLVAAIRAKSIHAQLANLVLHASPSSVRRGWRARHYS